MLVKIVRIRYICANEASKPHLKRIRNFSARSLHL